MGRGYGNDARFLICNIRTGCSKRMPVEFQYKEASIISKPRSVREAHTKLQAFYLDPISDIAAALGVQLNNAKAWTPTSANRYTRKGERDAIIFPEVFEMLSSRWQMGDPIITNRESEWSLVQPVINDTPEPVEEMVRYSTRKTENFLESESSTQTSQAWSIPQISRH